MKNNTYPYYAIQISGSKNNIFTLKEVVALGATNPVDVQRYRTEEKARSVAEQMGITIEKISDIYQIA